MKHTNKHENTCQMGFETATAMKERGSGKTCLAGIKLYLNTELNGLYR